MNMGRRLNHSKNSKRSPQATVCVNALNSLGSPWRSSKSEKRRRFLLGGSRPSDGGRRRPHWLVGQWPSPSLAPVRWVRHWWIRLPGVLPWLAVPALAATQEPDEIPELRPPEELLPPTFWEQHAWGASLSVACIVVGLALILWWLRRPKAVVTTPVAVLARKALEALRNRPENFPLVSEVSRIVRHYLASALTLRSDELTPEELEGQLKTHPLLGRELAHELIAFFRACDEKKFSPQPPAPPLGAVERARQFVEQIELRRREAERAAPAQASPASAASPTA